MTPDKVNGHRQNGHVATQQTKSCLEGVGSAATEVLQRLWLIELSVEVLLAQTKIGKLWREGYREAMEFLKTIPLTTDEFAACLLRFDNALRYCGQGEFGAAGFELRMLRGILQKL
jgi:hypothetical protein